MLSSSGGEALKVFISYRRDDTAADARLVYERLAERFGHDNVFLDVVALEPGTRWLETIRSRGRASGVFLALIGPRWLSILGDREDARYEEPSDDVVKLELELALSRGSGVEVIPVLVGNAVMPGEEQLPRSLRRLSATHAVELRHTHFDQDAAGLVEVLGRIAARQAAPPAVARAIRRRRRRPPPTPAPAPAPATSTPAAAAPPPSRRTRWGPTSTITRP